ncbi:hypothetical protein [Nocardia sp. NPDC004711]
MNDEIQILQTTRLKGRPRIEDLSESLGLTRDALESALHPLLEAGLLEEVKGRVKLTPEGRQRLETLFAAMRAGTDQTTLSAAYHEFDSYNSRFKQLVTDWQLIDGERPNDHTDADYDNTIIRRLSDLHANFLELVARMAGIAPLLSDYPRRFTDALGRITAGEHRWLAAPLIDSYHTVWFELHENLIGLAGLSRVAEAAAGRAE